LQVEVLDYVLSDYPSQQQKSAQLHACVIEQIRRVGRAKAPAPKFFSQLNGKIRWLFQIRGQWRAVFWIFDADDVTSSSLSQIQRHSPAVKRRYNVLCGPSSLLSANSRTPCRFAQWAQQ
jgi:muconolactone delta-isomerase